VKRFSAMVSSLLVIGLAVAPVVAAPAPSKPPSAQVKQACALKGFTVTSVAPRMEDVQQGRLTTQRLAGATVYVQAEPGLTREWLRLSLERHLASMASGSSMKDCPFGAKDIRIAVDSAGTGFAVHVSAKDVKIAEEVLRRARLLQGQIAK
jgi:hypothetical protein